MLAIRCLETQDENIQLQHLLKTAEEKQTSQKRGETIRADRFKRIAEAFYQLCTHICASTKDAYVSDRIQDFLKDHPDLPPTWRP